MTPPKPMRAVTGGLPSDDDRWSYEIKWDGMRAIGVIEDGRLRLWSANGLEATDRFPELAPLATALGGHAAVVDGEIVALDDRGNPAFGRLQPRMQARSEAAVARVMATVPVVYVLFDLLAVDGVDTTALPYEERRRLLVDLLGDEQDDGHRSWRVTQAWTGGGGELLETVRERGMEGLVAKRLGSRYEAGRRSSAWRKVKARGEQELVVGGWLPGERGRAATFGALLVGYHDGDALRYAGRVGTGFTDAELRRWTVLLSELAQDECPFEPPPPPPVARTARWVRPEPVVEVAFAEWTADGLLRHPSYLGPRADKDPAEVVREG
jgi:bifunctional non-homologous end joining protein LigD